MYEQAEMYEQTEAFPKTRRDFAEEFLSHFQADVEAAEKSLVNAQVKLAAACRIRDDGEENLRLAIRAEEGIAGEPVVEGDAAEEAEDAEFEPIAAIEGDVLDPITGEVVSRSGADVSQTPHVVVFYPSEEQPRTTEIGEHTTYGELVARYLVNVEPDDLPESSDGWGVEDFRVIRVAGGQECKLNTRIVEWDYGQTFKIEALATAESAA